MVAAGGADSQTLLRERIAAVIATKTLAEWQVIFQQQDACVEPVLTFAEACAFQEAAGREMIIELQTGDGGTQRQIAGAVKLSKSPAVAGAIGGPMGEHSRDVLTALGLSDEAIAALYSSGAVA